MGTRRPHVLVDTTPAKTILVYRNGDAFFVGRRLVVPRRRVPTFEALLQQLTEQVDVPFGVRRLFTPTRGHPVRELQALQAGGKYVAAGREPFKKLDYIHIVPRKPGKMSKLKEIKPVVHCDLNVPSRWQTFQRTSRHVKLFTMNGHLLDNSKDLQDNHFYVAAGPETFKYFPYWKSSKVPSEVQRKYVDIEKYSREKKKEDSKGKETHKYDSIPRKERDSVFYARAGKKKTLVEPSFQSGSEGDVFRAQTPSTDTQEAPEVKEDSSVQVEVPVDQTPAEIVTEDEEIHDNPSDFESIKEDNSRMSFKKRFSLRHSTKEKEKEPYDLLEGKNTPVLLETPVKIEDRRQPPMGRQSREESSSGRSEEKPEDQELLEQPSWGQPSQEQIPDKREPSEQSSLTQSSQEQIPDTREPSYLNSHRWGKKR
ncbi:doublecortin domain-containing protein 2C isoform X5 [Leopardus geoffroyi]|uniref:doublecortin domain-containing protein 2C isoform X5 n=1 Tax=Leopardus geoffroyi TaxID=46844 RepID=UPI001E2609C5|nr:doublecortin domain-containing protein 2C isoform X5 [Leopardus geoffroyi]